DERNVGYQVYRRARGAKLPQQRLGALEVIGQRDEDHIQVALAGDRGQITKRAREPVAAEVAQADTVPVVEKAFRGEPELWALVDDPAELAAHRIDSRNGDRAAVAGGDG